MSFAVQTSSREWRSVGRQSVVKVLHRWFGVAAQGCRRAIKRQRVRRGVASRGRGHRAHRYRRMARSAVAVEERGSRSSSTLSSGGGGGGGGVCDSPASVNSSNRRRAFLVRRGRVYGSRSHAPEKRVWQSIRKLVQTFLLRIGINLPGSTGCRVKSGEEREL